MKNFACLILGMGLLVNATMANPIENDAVDRVKRGSLNFIVAREKNISAAKKNFIVAQIKELNKDIRDGGRKGKLAIILRDGLKKKFGGKWLVLGAEKDEFYSFAHADLNLREYVEGFYGQAYWGVWKI